MAEQINQDALKAVTKGNNNFAISLYKAISENGKNVFFSPISVEVVLALAHLGAKGQTAKEISDALSLPKERKIVEDGFNALMSTLKSTDLMTLEIANRAFIEATLKIKSDFKSSADKFLAGAENVDFIKNCENARIIINQWVEKKTNEKIKDLLAKGVLDSSTRLVLVNAIYFKGKWEFSFDNKRTSPEPFHISPTETKQVQMMHLKKKFLYGDIEKLDAQALELPYKGGDISMLVLLPKKIDGIQELEEKMVGVNVFEILNNMYNNEVILSFPKFKLEESMDLNSALKEMGMTSMFDEVKSDFSGISETEKLFVSKVVQKAFIEVNEEGSEAAAATAMIMCAATAAYTIPRPDIIFKADHPFLFTIFANRSQTIIFLGKHSAPIPLHSRCFVMY